MLHVLLYELLIGRKKSLQGKTAFEKALLKHRTFLAAEWARLKVKRKARSDGEMITTTTTTKTKKDNGTVETENGEGLKSDGDTSITLPRYVRVNTLKASVDDVVREYEKRVRWIGIIESSWLVLMANWSSTFGVNQMERQLYIWPKFRVIACIEMPMSSRLLHPIFRNSLSLKLHQPTRNITLCCQNSRLDASSATFTCEISC